MTLTARRAAVLLVALGSVALGACGDDDADSSASTTTSSSTSSTTSSSTTSTTVETTTTVPATTTTAGAPPPTPSAPVPGAVTAVSAGPSGGSGEVEVNWEEIAGATGYRVYRADAAGGPFAVSGDGNVTTGDVTLGEGATELWSPPGPAPADFQYIEVVPSSVGHRYFRVAAYNAAGEGPHSVVVCAAPPGGSGC